MRIFGYSWHTDLRILVVRVLHIVRESTLKMSYLGCFWFSFCQGYMVSKRWLYSAGVTALHMFLGHYSTRDWVAHILDTSNFCVRKTLFPVHNMNLHTVRSLSINSWFQVQCTHSFKEHRNPLQRSRHSSAHSLRWSSKLRFMWVMRDFADSWVTEQNL